MSALTDSLILILSALPVPSNFEQLLWLFMGAFFARAFGKKLDYNIQHKWPPFKSLGFFEQWFIKACLDFLHHWWIGALMGYYGQYIPYASIVTPVIWFGWGIFYDDLPDLKRRITELRHIEEGSTDG